MTSKILKRLVTTAGIEPATHSLGSRESVVIKTHEKSLNPTQIKAFTSVNYRQSIATTLSTFNLFYPGLDPSTWEKPGKTFLEVCSYEGKN